MKKYLLIIGALLIVAAVFFLSYLNPWIIDEQRNDQEEEEMTYEDLDLDPNSSLFLDIREQVTDDEREQNRLETSQYFEDHPELDERTKLEMYNDIFWIRTGLTHEDIKDAEVVFSIPNNEPQVIIYFTNAGYELLADISSRNINKRIGIFLDEEMISSPTVKESTKKDETLITGVQSEEDAKILVEKIKKSLEKNKH